MILISVLFIFAAIALCVGALAVLADVLNLGANITFWATELAYFGLLFLFLAGPANKQGRIVADNICGLNSEYKEK